MIYSETTQLTYIILFGIHLKSNVSFRANKIVLYFYCSVKFAFLLNGAAGIILLRTNNLKVTANKTSVCGMNCLQNIPQFVVSSSELSLIHRPSLHRLIVLGDEFGDLL